MKKVILAFSFSALASVFAVAQSTDDYKKVEVFAGYSNGQVDTGTDFQDRESFNGFNVSGVYNLNRYFGVKGDLSGTYNSNRFSGEIDFAGTPGLINVKNTNSLYNFLGGVQLKDNARSGRFKPFVHALVGGAHIRTKISDITCTPPTLCTGVPFPDQTFSDTGFAGAFGGGIDIRLNDKVQIRAIQLDYNPVRIDGSTQNNVRIGAGIVF